MKDLLLDKDTCSPHPQGLQVFEKWEELYLPFLLTLGMRALTWFFVFHHRIGGDEGRYWNQAQSFLHHRYVEKGFLPLWSFVLSSALQIHNVSFTGRLLSSFIASFSAIFVFQIAKIIFDSRTAWVAAVLYAIYPEHVAFSHYMYAEIMLEFFLVSSTWLIISSCQGRLSKTWLPIGFFLLGVGLLSKHFAIVSYIGFLVVFLVHYKETMMRKQIALSLFFFLAPTVYFLNVGARGKDGFAFVNLPIKNAHEWFGGGFFKGYQGHTKTETVRKLMKRKAHTSFAFYLKKIKSNILNIWSPNSYPIMRLLANKYPMSNPWWLVAYLALFHLFLVMTGITGLVTTRGLFTTYTIANFSVLSIMGIVWWMVSRYRISFMYMLILYSAYTLSHFSLVKFKLLVFPKKKILWLGLMILVVFIFFSRIGSLGRWT